MHSEKDVCTALRATGKSSICIHEATDGYTDNACNKLPTVKLPPRRGIRTSTDDSELSSEGSEPDCRATDWVLRTERKEGYEAPELRSHASGWVMRLQKRGSNHGH